MDELLLAVNINEVLRYAGQSAAQADPQLLWAAEQELAQVRAVAAPRYVAVLLPLRVEADGLHAGALRLPGATARQFLTGCDAAYLLAATLGAETDRLIRRRCLLDISRGALAQAAATACLEAYTDRIQSELDEQAQQQGRYLHQRFSPGYGDLPLDCQRALLGETQAGKTIGLSLTASLMLTPLKSLTAVIGVSDRAPTGCSGEKCVMCAKTDCVYRKG